MKIALVVLLAGISLFAVGCQSSENTEGFKVYGGKAEPKQVLTLSDVVARADALKEQRICVKGDISEVCKNRGCWMTVTDGKHTARVRFTKSDACSEGFYVPRNAAGHKALMNGIVEVMTLSQAEARHYAEDNGKSVEEIEKIQGPQTEITFFADAVMISDGDKLEPPVQ
ncbi:MAG: DUF4920 domain-containing protein [Planctomycetes bacterium]|nr:DUF4920 domain-containing protein [Planctomycetota bacterium]